MNSKFTSVLRSRAVDLYQSGLTSREVAEVTGISEPHIKTLVRKAGIARPSGFRHGNPGSKGRPLSQEARSAISKKHKSNGHSPSPEAVQKGQPRSLKARWGTHKKDPVSKLIYIYKQGASKRGLSYCLSRTEFENLISASCFYCGIPPTARNVNGSALICNGIDRSDNSVGYVIDNCLTACKTCNIMKSSRSKNEFIEHCIMVAGNAKT